MPSSSTGIAWTNSLTRERYTTNQIHLNGSGVAAGDVDGDGRCDLYFCGLDGNNALFRNLGGWRFEEIAAQAGVACPGLDSTGAAFADLDGDGDLDLVVNTIMAGTRLYFNEGRGRFKESSAAPPLNLRRGGMSLALADIDGDEDLDLYVVNYRTVTVRDQPSVRIKGEYVNGLPVIASVDGRPASDPEVAGRFTLEPAGKIIENGEIDVLFRNEGGGRWTPLSFTDGTFLDEEGKPLASPPYEWGLSAMFRDINRDGAPDLYVCNDFRSPDRLWLNDGKGHFRAAPRLALRHTSLFSMGVDFADVDRDGFDDFFVADMLSRDYVRRQVQVGELAPLNQGRHALEFRPQYPHNTLFHNRGDGTMAEIAWFAGVQASEWSWAPVFIDMDLDGYEDLLITNGHERDAMNADVMRRAEQEKNNRKLSPSELLNLNNLFARLDTENVAFRNRGGSIFEDVSASWGFNSRGVSHGIALGDLDGDGDLDVAVNNLNGEAGVYRNDGNGGRVAVRLRGNGANRYGIGGRVTLLNGAVPSQSQEIISGGRYLSGDEPARVFATGPSPASMVLEVEWRNGKRSRVEGVLRNHAYEIDEPSGSPAVRPPTPAPAIAAWFEDLSAHLGHQHHDESVGEEDRQPSLGKSLNRLGAGLAWIDVSGDGVEDLVAGSGKGGSVRAFRNTGEGRFQEIQSPPWNRPLTRDVLGLAGWEGVVVAALAGIEEGQAPGGSLRIFDASRNTSGESLRGESFGGGPLALADLDHDGDLDLFLGGRYLPGRYPVSADSLLLRNEGGRLSVWQRFQNAGLVSGALFSDLNGDGTLELVLACEWGPVRVFQLENGTFTEATARLGLDQDRGWWNGVAAGDFDGDGRLDLVASNWGLNSRYHASRKHPLKGYYGDFAGDGGVVLLETQWESSVGRDGFVRDRKSVLDAIPRLAENLTTFEKFGQSSIEQVLGDSQARAAIIEVTTLANSVFLNRGSHFERVELPAEAQWAPAFGVNVADADGDGNEDVFLSQNFFGNLDQRGRCDAGRGLWLRGNGNGGFSAVSGTTSGVILYGEQRGSAVCDFDADGRVDLAVAQHGAETKLFRNKSARPGLRVRLRGAGVHASGTGAAVRVRCDGRWGPVREIHSGSGYCSQDSAVQVLGLAGELQAVWVRWPGGKTFEKTLNSSVRDIEITQKDESIKVIR